MNFKIITVSLILSTTLTGCSSPSIIPTKDVCSLEKHMEDNLFQVRINEVPINQNYYIYNEATDIMRQLAKKNKCRAQ